MCMDVLQGSCIDAVVACTLAKGYVSLQSSIFVQRQ